MADLLLRMARALSTSLPIILLLILLVTVGVGWWLVHRLRAQALERVKAAGESGDEDEAAAEPAETRGGFRRLERAFDRAMKTLERHVPNRDERAGVPWILLLGREGSRRPDLLAGAGLPTAFAPPEAVGSEPAHRLSWWFFYPGAVLDLGGGYVQTPSGRGADRRGWRRFLRLLQRHRPERPLDGVVVTIPLEDLLRFETGDDEPGALSLEDRASDLQAHLGEIQDVLGMRVPVTVLVTGCERLRGFGGFTRALAERGEADDLGRLDRPLPQMLGWSNPNDPQALYRAEWVDRAFAEINEGLDAAQADLLAGQPAGRRRADDLFLFPLALRRLREPLGRVLDTLFRASTYHAGDLFRGLYFTGTGDVPQDPTTPRPQHFVKDLFERKVFPETRLAEPLADTVLSRNRRVLTAQIGVAAAALVLSLGLWWAWSQLEARNQKLEPFLETVSKNLRRGQMGSADAPPDLGQMQTRAEALLQGMADLDARRYWSLFLPTSWSGSINRQLEGAIVQAYEDVLFQALHSSFEHKTEILVCEAGSAPRQTSRVPTAAVQPRTVQGIPRPAALPELQTLLTYVEDLEELDVHSAEYNELPTTESLEALSEVVRYLFGTQLSAEFFENDALYQQALPQVTYAPFRAPDRVPPWLSSACLDRLAPQRSSQPSWRKLASVQAARITTDLYDRLFWENPLAERLAELRRGLERLVLERRVRPTDRSDLDSLRSLLEMLRNVDALLDEPGLAWVFEPSLSLGPQYERILTGLEVSSFLTEGFAHQVRDAGQGNFEVLQTNLVEAGAESTGPFLQSMENRPTPELTEELQMLRDALEAFLSEEGFQPPPLSANLANRLGPDQRLLWDDLLLADATDLWEPYESFRSDTLGLVPQRLRPALDRIAREQVAARIHALVGRAQRFLSLEQTGGFDLELGISTQVDNLAQATPHLRRLVEIFQDLDQPQLRTDLVETVQRQGTHLLGDVDALLGRSRLYLPREGDFAWWDGEHNVAFAAFSVPDVPGLEDYLERQRRRVTELTTRYARPTLDALALTRPTSPARGTELYERWTTIVDVLDAYGDGDPGNALGELETFITTELPGIGLVDCLPKTAGADAGDDENNFFLERKELLETLLHRRCDVLVGRRAVAAWNEIRTLYNQRLAGRFPFSRERSGTPDAVGHEAATTALTALYGLVDRERELILSVPEDHPAFQGSGARVRTFLSDLDTLETFLAPFLAAPDREALPQVLVTVDFRADRNAERGGEQILAWELTVADQAVDARDAEPRLPWQLGDDLTFVLRWAKDSPWVPRATLPDRPTSAIDGTRALYRYRDAWSLVSFVRTHLDRARFDGPSSVEPLPLRFDVQTVPRTLPRTGADIFGTAPIQEARVFVRVAFFHPETEEPLPWPCFPTEAPKLGEGSSGPTRNWWCHGS